RPRWTLHRNGGSANCPRNSGSSIIRRKIRIRTTPCGPARSRAGPNWLRLRELVGERAYLQHWSAVTQTHATGSPTHLLEVFNARVNKWTMVEAYCRK